MKTRLLLPPGPVVKALPAPMDAIFHRYKDVRRLSRRSNVVTMDYLGLIRPEKYENIDLNRLAEDIRQIRNDNNRQ